MIQDSNKENTIEFLLAQNAEYKNRIAFLEHEIGQLKRLIFGSKSERYISKEQPLHPNTLFSETQDNQQPQEKQCARGSGLFIESNKVYQIDLNQAYI